MTPPELVLLIKHFEGLSKVKSDGLVYPYLCPAGYPTQGYGIRVESLAVPPITRDEAEDRLARVLPMYIQDTVALCPVLADEPRKLAALADFTFNLGRARLAGSTLRKRVNARNWAAAQRELSRWVWGLNPRTGTMEQLPGLVLRRQAEAAILN